MNRPSRPVQDERVHVLADAPPREGARWVLYWMQQSQRAEDNPALEHAAGWADRLGLPLVVGFGLMDGYPGANLRHYRFMAEGLRETARSLARRRIPLVVRRGDPAEVALELARDAAIVVCDRGYLRHQRAWRRRVAEGAGRRVEEVEGDAVVPVELASDKREYAARTLRPKIHRRLGEFLVALRPAPLDVDSFAVAPDGLDTSDPDALLGRCPGLDRGVPPVTELTEGGTSRGKARLRRFIDEGLEGYAERRPEPWADATSGLSPYLHFGQVSPVWAAVEVSGCRNGSREDRAAFVEQLVVRRELALNFAWFEPGYDTYEALPEWARRTLDEHRDDEREALYSRAQLEAAETHDPYWNAAQREMVHTGAMHNHMRMYWGKQILAWSPSPEEAWRTALELNDRYCVDGRGPSSYANVGWLFGLHDRPWGERDVFGTVRVMTRGGLERKTDPDRYVAKVEAMVSQMARMTGSNQE